VKLPPVKRQHVHVHDARSPDVIAADVGLDLSEDWKKYKVRKKREQIEKRHQYEIDKMASYTGGDESVAAIRDKAFPLADSLGEAASAKRAAEKRANLAARKNASSPKRRHAKHKNFTTRRLPVIVSGETQSRKKYSRHMAQCDRSLRGDLDARSKLFAGQEFRSTWLERTKGYDL
jgi:hypothetical protein